MTGVKGREVSKAGMMEMGCDIKAAEGAVRTWTARTRAPALKPVPDRGSWKRQVEAAAGTRRAAGMGMTRLANGHESPGEVPSLTPEGTGDWGKESLERGGVYAE